MFKRLAIAVSLLTLVPLAQAYASSKTIYHPTITMKAGNRAGLQNVFAWDENCKTVPVSIRAYKPRMVMFTYTNRDLKFHQAKAASALGGLLVDTRWSSRQIKKPRDQHWLNTRSSRRMLTKRSISDGRSK